MGADTTAIKKDERNPMDMQRFFTARKYLHI